MSETKFTKGPWEILPAEDDKEYLRIRGTALGRRYKIANVIDLKFHHDESKWCKLEREESVANANLIACAPDMYEMLESACNELYGLINEVNKHKLTSVNSQTETPPDLHDMETCHLIQELLKRARGE
ncbi:hypothetical protein [Pseudoalteromonas sp.]|uniref:hypothetical protein n=1 Tax=Pseudoalteromonas sp. TaxID=53249 RepID=UPI003D12802B